MKFVKALFGGMTSGRPRRAAARARLGLEALDDRCVPACTVTLVGGVLDIEGTAAGDAARVYEFGGHVIVEHQSAGDPNVSRSVWNGGPGVRGIRFRGFAGDDCFQNDTALPSEAHGGAGNDTLTGGRAADDLYGGHGDDFLSGGDGEDYLYGAEGSDTLLGGGHADILKGGDGDDTLKGGDGDDYLHGGAGADVLSGGRGDDGLRGGDDGEPDSLWGDEGADRFYLAPGDGAGDFDRGEGDGMA
jgi:Ca2+-binding RTX toxin-like protein